MKLTCVTAVFNAIASGNRENLIRCVASVAALKTEHEHLVYDGASTDGTVELLRELEAKTPGLKVASEKDTGIYNALNKGLRDARGEWFYVLGCDDRIVKPEVFLATLEQGEACQAEIVSSPVFVSEDLTRIKRLAANAFLCETPPHQGIVMRTALARRLQGFDERYRIAGDYDLILRALVGGCRFLSIPSAYTLYGTKGRSGAVGNHDCYCGELRRTLQSAFDMSETEAEDIVHRRPASLRPLVRCLRSRSGEIRQSARYMLARYLLRKLGLINKNGAVRGH